MLELLNQLDGFDTRGDVKVIMATNRIESLDPALIRPGRIDRKIEFPLPDVKTKRHIFKLHTSRMSLGSDVDLEEFVTTKDDLSGADIKAVCTEAGLLALRERRMRVTKADFATARERVGVLVLGKWEAVLTTYFLFFIGSGQEEGRCAGGLVPMILYVISYSLVIERINDHGLVIRLCIVGQILPGEYFSMLALRPTMHCSMWSCSWRESNGIDHRV
jgi:hypothetical protein